ncbi:TetR/AcrR family transcriptional regulator C-terminal domain-containing protein [Aeromicrobium chenweiae]|uniref:TetR family transcriptional regulator n=1 Tax=Aeromicrobium chenweiae TaxID=2079793 RepID=A0A2S0WI32_9ACTN|nr:TetR/AcrR family transcriptional regulator C-terminal domain-containing protein [Aeromicrobium chenweiae]AWB90995.1 TetR family transcriptional regulator [Aeromicrobium chenweiae]TGN31898.1 TetR family transcriptional regulator [Aeromicrobium chenweiae]
MRYHRTDIVERAVGVLDQYGLADLSMRRIASELGLQPSALYHHFGSKQELLAAVADEVLERGARPDAPDTAWDDRVVALSRELRDAMLAYRDGAELVATVHAFGLGVRSPAAPLASAIEAAGFDEAFARTAAMTVLHFVFGHVSDEQTHRQANTAGAIDADPLGRADTASFDLGLSLILEGIRHRAAPVRTARH